MYMIGNGQDACSPSSRASTPPIYLNLSCFGLVVMLPASESREYAYATRIDAKVRRPGRNLPLPWGADLLDIFCIILGQP
jgi:hypothetical protein